MILLILIMYFPIFWFAKRANHSRFWSCVLTKTCHDRRLRFRWTEVQGYFFIRWSIFQSAPTKRLRSQPGIVVEKVRYAEAPLRGKWPVFEVKSTIFLRASASRKRFAQASASRKRFAQALRAVFVILRGRFAPALRAKGSGTLVPSWWFFFQVGALLAGPRGVPVRLSVDV